jgi:ferric-dicitrate binding protein FerR (iron transport regulator)
MGVHDVTKPPEEPQNSDISADPIARLIRLAGPRPPVPEERMARVRDSVRARWREAVKSERRRVVLTAAQIAAALLIVIGAGFWLRDRIRVAGVPAATVVRTEGRVLLRDGLVALTGSVLAPGSGLTTGPDGRAALRLGDGPSVRLDSGTDLRLVSARVFELQGGAVYVDTGPRSSGKSAPIQIRTSLGRVRDVGTQFEVRLTGGTLQLSVREGIAALDRDDRSHEAPAGTLLRVGPRGAVETGTVALRGADWDWVLAVAPAFDLEGRTLRQYLDWLSRETGWRVGYADPSIAAGAATVILHGSTSGLRPDETPAAVLPTCGLRHRLDGGTLIIERASDTGGHE